MKTKVSNQKKRSTTFAITLIISIQITFNQPIIVDHTYTDISKIPGEWIQKVKNHQKLFTVAGESHGCAYMYGLNLVGADDTTFAVS
jgi:hypothetical protein